jgi:hypothetical protein
VWHPSPFTTPPTRKQCMFPAEIGPRGCESDKRKRGNRFASGLLVAGTACERTGNPRAVRISILLDVMTDAILHGTVSHPTRDCFPRERSGHEQSTAGIPAGPAREPNRTGGCLWLGPRARDRSGHAGWWMPVVCRICTHKGRFQLEIMHCFRVGQASLLADGG